MEAGRGPIFRLSPSCARAVRIRTVDGLHAYRAYGYMRISLRPELGLSGYKLFCADCAVRCARGFYVFRRPYAQKRHRGNTRLGARALPQGRLGACEFRRHAFVRIRRPAARGISRMGYEGVRFGEKGGFQLPDCLCILLGGKIPYRRIARGRGCGNAL